MTDPEALPLATIDRIRGRGSHMKGKYAREHTWHLAGGTKIKASATDAMLPEGYRDKIKLNPASFPPRTTRRPASGMREFVP